MHTPEQAEALWCPMMRLAESKPGGIVEGGQAVFSRLQKGKDVVLPIGTACIAGKCAMWRWGEQSNDPYDPAPPRLGYCGMAGRPA